MCIRDRVTAGIERSLQLLFVMRFAQNVQSLHSRDPGQRYQLFLIEGGGNQQDGVGAVRSGFDDLQFVDDEIFAQAGKRTAGGGLAQIFQRALEELFVRQPVSYTHLDADGVRSSANAGDDSVRKFAFGLANLRAGFASDDPMKIAHHGRIGMRSQHAAEQVVRCLLYTSRCV